MREAYLDDRNSYKIDTDDAGVATMGYSEYMWEVYKVFLLLCFPPPLPPRDTHNEESVSWWQEYLQESLALTFESQGIETLYLGFILH